MFYIKNIKCIISKTIKGLLSEQNNCKHYCFATNDASWVNKQLSRWPSSLKMQFEILQFIWVEIICTTKFAFAFVGSQWIVNFCYNTETQKFGLLNIERFKPKYHSYLILRKKSNFYILYIQSIVVHNLFDLF